jgi:hypothetical protein
MITDARSSAMVTPDDAPKIRTLKRSSLSLTASPSTVT